MRYEGITIDQVDQASTSSDTRVYPVASQTRMTLAAGIASESAPKFPYGDVVGTESWGIPNIRKSSFHFTIY